MSFMPNLAGAKRRLRERADLSVAGGCHLFQRLGAIEPPELALAAGRVYPSRGLVLGAELGAGLDLGSKDITGGDRWNSVFRRQRGGLGPLAGPWRAEEHEIERHAQYLHGKPIGSL